jgi:hypothetical protein
MLICERDRSSGGQRLIQMVKDRLCELVLSYTRMLWTAVRRKAAYLPG